MDPMLVPGKLYKILPGSGDRVSGACRVFRPVRAVHTKVTMTEGTVLMFIRCVPCSEYGPTETSYWRNSGILLSDPDAAKLGVLLFLSGRDGRLYYTFSGDIDKVVARV